MTPSDNPALDWAHQQLHEDPPTPGEPVRDVPVTAVETAREREYPDVPPNTFCDVIRGPHAGRYGVYSDTATSFSDGTPDTVVLQTRDDDDLRIVVAYNDIKPAEPGRR